MNALEVYIPESEIVERFPDTERYKHRFTINSESSDAKYMISYDTAVGCWKCSCRGNIRHGRCKHLSCLGLIQRYDVDTKRVNG